MLGNRGSGCNALTYASLKAILSPACPENSLRGLVGVAGCSCQPLREIDCSRPRLDAARLL